MPEALARAEHDFLLAEPAPARKRASPGREAARAPAKPRAKAPPAPAWRQRLLSQPGRTALYGALAAGALGIIVNAVALQKTRHPAPLFMTPVAPTAAASAPTATPAPQPAARPADIEAVATPAPRAAEPAAEKPKSAKADAIAQLLLRQHVGAETSDGTKKIAAAQRALQKLGYVLRPDGVFGGTTRQAIEMFERDRGLPIKGELTAKLARELTAQSGVPIP